MSDVSPKKCMKHLFCWLLILLFLQCILPNKYCEETRDVFAMSGEELTLQVSVVETKLISRMLWVTSRGVHIATSYTNGSMEVREELYADRLNASRDGSLIIKHLQREDGGIIKASIFLKNEGDCSQTYNLNITDPCGVTKKVSAPVGGNVTLRLQDGSIAHWERPGGVNFATTKTHGYIEVQGQQYRGRLQGSHDGSLTITNLSAPDQGEYRAFLFPEDGVGCVRRYNVSISDKSLILRVGVAVYVISGIAALSAFD